MLFARWRMKRFIRPLLAEMKADREEVERGPEEWTDWWRRYGQRELRCILMTAWDPIGVADAPEAWDEYDGYAEGVAHRLRDNNAEPEQAAREVADFLLHVERDWIGTGAGAAKAADTAEALVAWYEWSYVHGGAPPTTWRA